MSLDYESLARRWMGRDDSRLTPRENAVVKATENRRGVARDISVDYASSGGYGGWLADTLTRWAGSWIFIILFLVGLVFWSILNTEVLGVQAFDPYPYVFLNLVLSMLAAIQAPVILMAANRQAERDRIDARHDYEVNLKAELEIMGLHEKLDSLRREEIRLLVQELATARAEVAALKQAVAGER